MVKLFLTKTWGFGPEEYPAFGFSTEGARNKFLRESSREDWVVIAGTRGEPTPEHERGHLLGMWRVGKDKIDGAKLREELGREIQPHEMDKNGNFKWPYAMPILEAVRFVSQPDTSDILGTYLPGQEWAAYALDVSEQIGPDAVDAILALPTEPCKVSEVPSLLRAKIYADTLSPTLRSGPSGPPPSGERSGSARELGEGYAYAFKLSGGPENGVIKIGYTDDVQDRLNKLNGEIRPHLTGCSWKPFMEQRFTEVKLAFNFEQKMIEHLRANLVPGDREVVRFPDREFQLAWAGVLSKKEWIDVEGGDE